MLNRLTPDQIISKLAFIDNYIKAQNAADGSLVDANANVTRKTIATLEAEMYKFEQIQVNRALVCDTLEEIFPGEDLPDQYLNDIESHLIYIHDETSLKPYCASISLYPFLFEGTKCLGGTSKAPQNLQSFCGSFVNLVYQIASGFAGAIATVEFLMYFDYFARKQYGSDYLTTNTTDIVQEFQGVVYAMNQPAASRGDQSVFWNISVFDEYYFEELFGTFYFPDGSQPAYRTLARLQDFFMDWFRMEREKELLTFPVLTAAMLIDKGTSRPKDTVFERMIAWHMSKGLSFFIYQSESADSLSSCCRLRNELVDNTFSFSLGAGGVSTGAKQVITLNLNRLEQTASDQFTDIIDRIQKYLVAHDKIQRRNEAAGLLPAYTAGFINMDKQFLTIGINGAVEAAEYLGMEPNDNDRYLNYLTDSLSAISDMNKEAYLKYGVRFNTEFVPAESLGVKNAMWDKKDGLEVNRDCYNSYFYPVEDQSISILEKLTMHGKYVSKYLDGGAAVHLNLMNIPSYDSCLALIRLAAEIGVPYWTWNVLMTVCDKCGFIDPNTRTSCVKCGSTDLDYATRIIGYLKRISDYSQDRQNEHSKRHYADNKGV